MKWTIETGDQVRFPGFPEVLTVEAISGALATVSWQRPDGGSARAEVFLSRLEPAEAYDSGSWKMAAGADRRTEPLGHRCSLRPLMADI